MGSIRCITQGALAAVACAGVMAAPAQAQSRLEGRYAVTVAGVSIGKGAWIVDISDDQFTAAASGRVSGVLSVITSGEGAAASRGLISHGRFLPTTYGVKISSEGKSDQVRFSLLKDGAVRDLVAEPELPPHPGRVPVLEGHKRGVLDPITAGLILMNGTGDTVVPEVCQRTMPVFDGRQRYDLALSFKRMEKVKAEKGYQGPVVVCGVQYIPVSGHRPDRSAIKFLAETRESEIWYAPIAGTRALAPFRISVPTFIGTAVLLATQFVTNPVRTRPQPAKTQ